MKGEKKLKNEKKKHDGPVARFSYVASPYQVFSRGLRSPEHDFCIVGVHVQYIQRNMYICTYPELALFMPLFWCVWHDVRHTRTRGREEIRYHGSSNSGNWEQQVVTYLWLGKKNLGIERIAFLPGPSFQDGGDKHYTCMLLVTAIVKCQVMYVHTYPTPAKMSLRNQNVRVNFQA